MGVASVLSDYIPDMPPTLPTHPGLANEKYIQLGGNPWSSENLVTRETLEMSIIACLTREGFKLSMDITMDATSRVFFFIRDNSDPSHGEVRVPTFAGFGLGEKDGMSVHRPIVVRSKSSFFRSYRSTTVKNRIKKSFRRKAINNETNVMSYKPQNAGTAWWQQSSTDVSSDYEFYEGPSEVGNQKINHL